MTRALKQRTHACRQVAHRPRAQIALFFPTLFQLAIQVCILRLKGYCECLCGSSNQARLLPVTVHKNGGPHMAEVGWTVTLPGFRPPFLSSFSQPNVYAWLRRSCGAPPH